MSKKLEPPDLFALSAAVGWMELGLPSDAEAELKNVSAENQSHPDVLEVKWAVLSQAKRWDDAVSVARDLLRIAPHRSSGWLHHAYAVRRATDGGLERAWEALLPASEKFPRDSTIAYNLACYACQMGQMETARTWFRRALEIGSRDRMKQMALADLDLAPLWDEIRGL